MVQAAMAKRQDIQTSMFRNEPVRWQAAPALVPYADAVAHMEQTAANIADGTASELVWLVEHPPVYTAGTSAKPQDLLAPDRFPVFQTGRGGQYTYHGPGQRVAYVMLDLRKRGQDVRAFVAALERWIITTLAEFEITGEVREDRVGVWVSRPGREDKIAALGIRVRRGVTFHGIAINLSPDLEHFDGIVPCGVAQHGITSFRDLGYATTMIELDIALQKTFAITFAPIAK
jgi:lipoyl(octanoyl) transferase